MELQAYYRKALETHLLEALRLDLYEEEFDKSKLGFMRPPDCSARQHGNQAGAKERSTFMGIPSQ
jgi:hypothetical protein